MRTEEEWTFQKNTDDGTDGHHTMRGTRDSPVQSRGRRIKNPYKIKINTMMKRKNSFEIHKKRMESIDAYTNLSETSSKKLEKSKFQTKEFEKAMNNSKKNSNEESQFYQTKSKSTRSIPRSREDSLDNDRLSDSKYNRGDTPRANGGTRRKVKKE
jgi:hypothetical protein